LAAVVERRQVWMRAVRDRAARQAEDAHADALEVVERSVEVLERDAEVRLRLPAPRVRSPQATGTEDLDGKAEPVGVDHVRLIPR